MKSIYNYLTAPICLIAILLLVGSCSGEYEYKTDYSSYQGATLKVDLVDDNNTLQLKLANNTHQITVGVTPENVLIDLKAYIYQISDESIVAVDKEGMLTLKKEGEAELTIKFRGDQALATSCKVKVTRDPVFVSDLKVPLTAQVQEMKVLNLAALITVLPGTADNQKLHYEVADELVAKVDENGIVTGVKEGLTTIKVTTTDGTNLSKTIPLTVVGEIKVSKINLNAAATLGGKKVGVSQVFKVGSVVTVLPANASNKEVTYAVEGTAVSVDDKGTVTTNSPGAAKVIVTAGDGSGVTAEVSFTVDATVTDFERTFWTVETSSFYEDTGLNYVADGSTGKPEHLFDGKSGTYLSLRKPEYPGNANKELFFIADMGAEHEFNYFKYRHRNLNNLLAAEKITVSGSHNGEDFDVLKGEFDLTPYSGSKDYIGDLSGIVKYRYVKVQITQWVKTNGSSGTAVQTSEFNVGKK